MARKSNFNTLLNNFLKKPDNLLYLGGALAVGWILYRNFAVPKSPIAPPVPNPVLTKTQVATDDGSTWTYGNVSNDDIAPGAGPSFAQGVSHNQSILDRDLRTPENFHTPDVENVIDGYGPGTPTPDVMNAYAASISPSHDYFSSVIPSNSSGPIGDFDTNNEIVEVVDYSP